MDQNDIIPNIPQQQSLLPENLARLGLAANESAARHRFEDYQSRRSTETLRRQKADLNLFIEFLMSVGFGNLDLFTTPLDWAGITWGLVEAFTKWQINQGYAIQTVNIRLSTVKTYSKLAMQAGIISAQEYALIRSISGYTQKEQRRIDKNRPVTPYW